VCEYIYIHQSGLRPDRRSQQAALHRTCCKHAASYFLFSACLSSTVRCRRQADAAEFHYQIGFRTTFCRPTTRSLLLYFFKQDGTLHVNFDMFFGFFFVGGVSLSPWRDDGHPALSQGNSLNKFWVPRGIILHSFGCLWGALGGSVDIFFAPGTIGREKS
jgi:hypothetical protein